MKKLESISQSRYQTVVNEEKRENCIFNVSTKQCTLNDYKANES